MLSESLMMKLGERGYDLHGAIAPDMIAALRQRFAAALKNRKTDILQVSIVIDEIQQGKAKLDESVRRAAIVLSSADQSGGERPARM